MRDHPHEHDVDSMVKRVGYTKAHTLRVLKDLRACGLVHVSSWRRQPDGQRGYPAKLWRFGHGVDAPMPKAKDMARSVRESYHRTRKRSIEQFGIEVTRKIFVSRKRGGIDRLVIDGKTVYERKTRRQWAAKNT
jgi:hypothetical protein